MNDNVDLTGYCRKALARRCAKEQHTFVQRQGES